MSEKLNTVQTAVQTIKEQMKILNREKVEAQARIDEINKVLASFCISDTQEKAGSKKSSKVKKADKTVDLVMAYFRDDHLSMNHTEEHNATEAAKKLAKIHGGDFMDYRPTIYSLAKAGKLVKGERGMFKSAVAHQVTAAPNAAQ